MSPSNEWRSLKWDEVLTLCQDRNIKIRYGLLEGAILRGVDPQKVVRVMHIPSLFCRGNPMVPEPYVEQFARFYGLSWEDIKRILNK